MEYIKNTLFELCEASFSGNCTKAGDSALKELSKYTFAQKIGRNIIGYMGNGDYTVMLCAHIDEVGFVVSEVTDGGFVTVAKCGGIDLRHLPSKRVVIHGKTDVTGVFCSVPPHLKNGETDFSDISEFKIDTLLGEKAKEVISVGDAVTFLFAPTELSGNKVTSKALDNRVGVTCLLELAKRLCKKTLPVKVAFVFSSEEELGLRGAKTAAFYVNPDEAVAIDVTFGDTPSVNPLSTKPLSSGAAIGISPVLDRKIGEKLISLSKDGSLPYTTEIMASKTGTDADIIAISKQGVKTGLVSVPIRNMHTPAEVVDLEDIKTACDLLESYILSGGIKNV